MKDLASSNIPRISVTLDTFHLLSGWLKDLAEQNKPNICVDVLFIYLSAPVHLCNSPTKRARTVVAKETLVAQEPNSRTYHPKPHVPSLLGGRHNGIVAHLLDETRSERSAVGLDSFTGTERTSGEEQRSDERRKTA